jgi:hypothetical protein
MLKRDQGTRREAMEPTMARADMPYSNMIRQLGPYVLFTSRDGPKVHEHHRFLSKIVRKKDAVQDKFRSTKQNKILK